MCPRNRARYNANIIPVLDCGVTGVETGSVPFYVMPLLEGGARTRLASVSDPEKRLAYFDQILSGVEAAHLQGVIHRDLKPENLLFNTVKDCFVVADFGIAHFMDEELYTAVETRPGDRLANFQYAAPEQRRRGGTTDARTDIYSLGLILNEIFTREVPYGPGYRTVASVVPNLAWVDDIVVAMIQQDPTSRPVSIDAVKRQFIANRQEYTERQRLSELSRTVIPVGEEDDPLALAPLCIKDFEWKDNVLTLILSQPVNSEWHEALIKGHREAVWGKGPDRFRINGDRAYVQAEDSDIQRIIDYFKQWIGPATEIYRNRRANERRQRAEAERARLHREQEEITRQQRLRAEIRL